MGSPDKIARGREFTSGLVTRPPPTSHMIMQMINMLTGRFSKNR